MGLKKINLKRLQPKFIELVKGYLDKNGLTQDQLAKIVGIPRNNLNQLLNDSPYRPLTSYYIYPFLVKGIIMKDQIFDGKPENKRESDFWDGVSLADREALLNAIARIEKTYHGVDIMQDLKTKYPEAFNLKKA